MYVFESVLIDMGVDLCRGNVSVAEHHLYCTQVSAMAEHMACKGVP